MTIKRTISCPLLVMAITGAALAAPAPKSAKVLGPNTNIGKVNLTAASCEAGPGYLIYRTAHVKTDSGSTLDADKMTANLAKGTNALTTVVATGHVKAYAAANNAQPNSPNTYTITSDEAVYYPVSNGPKSDEIDFTKQVTVTILSKMTKGPLVQTGDSAIVKLGDGPDYPQITMNQVHTVFTPNQSSAP